MSISRLFFFLLVLASFSFPVAVSAHTSDERYVSGMIVDLSTAPIAPLLGEKTGFLFSFLDPESFAVIETIQSAQIEIVANERSNGKPQEVVYTSEVFPVVRGTLNFDHIFTEVGTYDVHITFTDGRGMVHTTGFRRQIRDLTPAERAITVDGVALGASFGIMFGVILGYILGQKKKEK